MDTDRRSCGRVGVVVTAAVAVGHTRAVAQSPDEKALAANLEAFREAYRLAA